MLRRLTRYKYTFSGLSTNTTSFHHLVPCSWTTTASPHHVSAMCYCSSVDSTASAQTPTYSFHRTHRRLETAVRSIFDNVKAKHPPPTALPETAKPDLDHSLGSNPFVARFFDKFYGSSIFPRVCETDTISLVLLGLAWMDIREYMKEASNTYRTRLFLQMPFERQFQSALMSGWKRFPDVLEARPEVIVPRKGEKRGKGRVDFELKVAGEKECSFVELLVFGKPISSKKDSTWEKKVVTRNNNTIKDHIAPFFTGNKGGTRGKHSYMEALAQGKEVVVVVFAHIEMRAEAVKRARRALASWKNRKHAEKLKVLVLGMRSAFRYSVDVVQLQENARGSDFLRRRVKEKN